MNGTFLKILLTLMATAFMAWAGVVWKSGQEAVRLTELNQQRVLAMVERVQELRDVLASHAMEPTHRQTGSIVSTVTQQLRDIDRRLDRLEAAEANNKFKSTAPSN